MSLKLCFSERGVYAPTLSPAPCITPLDNTIHPIFARKNFRREYARSSMQSFWNAHQDWISRNTVFSEPIYNRIEPALRLASIFLSKSTPFYAKIMCARISRSEISGNTMFETSFTPTDLQLLTVENELLQIARNTRFCIPSYDPHPTATADGTARLGRVYASLKCGTGLPTPQIKICIGLSHIFTHFFDTDITKKPFVGFEIGADDEGDVMKPERRTHVLFLLANTIASQVAKALFQWRMLSERAWNPDCRAARSQYGNSGEAEPLFSYTDSDRDLGRAWQGWFWGAQAKPINPFLQPNRPIGFYFLRWEESTEEQQPGTLGTIEKVDAWPLEMGHVAQLFGKELWSRDDQQRPALRGQTPVRALVMGKPGFDAVIDEYFTTRLIVGTSWVVPLRNRSNEPGRFGKPS